MKNMAIKMLVKLGLSDLMINKLLTGVTCRHYPTRLIAKKLSNSIYYDNGSWLKESYMFETVG